MSLRPQRAYSAKKIGVNGARANSSRDRDARSALRRFGRYLRIVFLQRSPSDGVFEAQQNVTGSENEDGSDQRKVARQDSLKEKQRAGQYGEGRRAEQTLPPPEYDPDGAIEKQQRAPGDAADGAPMWEPDAPAQGG